MKKITLLFAVVFTAASLFAQGERDYSTTAGDWSVSFNATPLLTYMGGFFSNAGATAPTFGSIAQTGALTGTTGATSVTGSYATTDDQNFWGTVTLGMASNSTSAANATDNTKIDETKTSGFDLVLSGGISNRVGNGRRVQGTWGYGGLLGTFGGGKTTFTDGDDSNNDFEAKTGGTLVVGAVGVVGVEFFLTEDISLGGAYRVFLGGNSTGDSEFTQGGTTTTTAYGGSGFNLNTAATGQVILAFYLR